MVTDPLSGRTRRRRVRFGVDDFVTGVKVGSEKRKKRGRFDFDGSIWFWDEMFVAEGVVTRSPTPNPA